MSPFPAAWICSGEAGGSAGGGSTGAPASTGGAASGSGAGCAFATVHAASTNRPATSFTHPARYRTRARETTRQGPDHAASQRPGAHVSACARSRRDRSGGPPRIQRGRQSGHHSVTPTSAFPTSGDAQRVAVVGGVRAMALVRPSLGLCACTAAARLRRVAAWRERSSRASRLRNASSGAPTPRVTRRSVAVRRVAGRRQLDRQLTTCEIERERAFDLQSSAHASPFADRRKATWTLSITSVPASISNRPSIGAPVYAPSSRKPPCRLRARTSRVPVIVDIVSSGFASPPA